MIPGPNIFFECPGCRNIMQMETIASGNTFGSKLYSDGKRESPMLPDAIPLTICRKCGIIFWTSKAKVIGEHYPWDKKEETEWENADSARRLNLKELTKAIRQKTHETISEEFYIRVMIWRGYNDRERKGEPMFNPLDEKYGMGKTAWKENLQVLLKLIDSKETDALLLKAEILRSLGYFLESIDVLSEINNPEYIPIRDAMMKRCNRLDDHVFLLED